MMGPCIFYNPDDEADTRIDITSTGACQPTPRMRRVYDAIRVAIRLCRLYPSDQSRFQGMKAHILAMRLPPSRLESLRRGAILVAYDLSSRCEAKPDDMLPAYGCQRWEFQGAAWLVARAALVLLVDIPLETDADADGLLEIALSCPGALPERVRRSVRAKLRRYVSARLDGHSFVGGKHCRPAHSERLPA